MIRNAMLACALVVATPAMAQVEQEVSLINDTGMTITQVFISPSGEDQWGPDLLGDGVFENSLNATISFTREEDACDWDILATFEGGGRVVWPGMNMCAISSIGLVYDVETGEATAMVE